LDDSAPPEHRGASRQVRPSAYVAPTAAVCAKPGRLTSEALSGGDGVAQVPVDDVAITLEVVPGVPHVFQAFAAVLDEGEAALSRAGAFLRAHIGTAAAGTAGRWE